jgi:hypothetical protein
VQLDGTVSLFSALQHLRETASALSQLSKEMMQSMLDTHLPLSYGGLGNTCASFDSMTYSSFLQVTT